MRFLMMTTPDENASADTPPDPQVMVEMDEFTAGPEGGPRPVTSGRSSVAAGR